MGAYKQFLASDIVITPFEVNKAFTFEGAAALTASVVSIDRFLGTNLSGLFNFETDPRTPTIALYTNNTVASEIDADVIDFFKLNGITFQNGVGINTSDVIYFDGFSGSPLTVATRIADTINVSSSNNLYSDLLGNITASSNLGSITISTKTLSTLINSFESGNTITYFNNNTTSSNINDVSVPFQRLIYNSVKQLYYSNYLSSSYGDQANVGYIVPGNDEAGNVLVGSTSSTGRYFNYNQTDLTFPKYFPTASGSIIGVLSIPSRLFGNYIQPNSFIWKSSSFTITDDGEGNLVSGSNIYGNIFYYHGMAILTSGSSSDILNFVTSSAVTCSFSSSLTIYETQYKCTIRSSEFNVTLNPTAEVSGSLLSYSGSYFYQPKGGVPTDNTTGSYFAPYVTTVGLYDEDQNLLAIGKLAQPLPTSATTDTTILVNIDR